MKKPKYCIDASIECRDGLYDAAQDVERHWHTNFREAWREARQAKKQIGPDAVVRIIEYDPAEGLYNRYSVPPCGGLQEWEV